MKAQIKVPAVGESITEGTIAQWTKKSGDFVKRDEVLLVLETDKASVEVVAETDGVLSTKANVGEVVKVGTVIGEIDTEGKGQSSGASSGSNGSAGGASSSPSAPPPVAAVATGRAPAGASSFKTETMSPAVRRVVGETGANPESIPGTGKDGRLTKSDVMGAAPSAGAGGGAGATVASLPLQAKSAVPAGFPKPLGKPSLGEDVVREPMSTIRRRIAERLVEAQSTAAILTTFNEIDMTQVMALRQKYKEKFEKKYGIGLGFMGFFVRAVIEGLRAFPRVNAFVDGNDVLYHNYYNIGVAVGTEKGLMVPVLKHAEQMSLAEIEFAIKTFAQKARDGKISVDDLNGGTFTISNGGVYGSLMSTPILNPPQSGILGMHKIEERPVAVGGQVVIRPMMYVALSYDHRIVDGGESVSFLVRVKDCIEDPTRLLLEI